MLLVACAGGGVDARYPARAPGCAVRSFPEQPTVAVDELGPVKVDCPAAGEACERQLLDAVCARGGDVAWGLADNALSASSLVAHAAHSRRLAEGMRSPGCNVRVLAEGGPPPGSENIGPVTAYCSPDDPKDACVRELADQVCRLGGNMLWQIDGPTVYGDKQRMRGRAAHAR